ncbi:hypothetical protein ACQUWN_04385 [Rossellomorea aquimaris]|nr:MULTISPECIES: hypothetical protein [Bacillaceae]
MFNIIKSFYEEKKADGTYTFTDTHLNKFIEKGYITDKEANNIRNFQQI